MIPADGNISDQMRELRRNKRAPMRLAHQVKSEGLARLSLRPSKPDQASSILADCHQLRKRK